MNRITTEDQADSLFISKNEMVGQFLAFTAFIVTEVVVTTITPFAIFIPAVAEVGEDFFNIS